MNPHPPLSSFPFVILCLLCILEAYRFFLKKDSLGIRFCTAFLLCALALISPLTYYSGFYGLDFADRSFEVPSSAIEQHQTFARLYLIFLVPTLLAYGLASLSPNYKRIIRCFCVFFLLLSLGLVAYVSFLGGDLVFNFGAGVKVIK